MKDLLNSINKKKKINKILIPNKNYNQHQIDTFFLNEIFDFYLKKYNTQKINIPNMKISNKDDNTSDYIYLIKNRVNNKKKTFC